MLPGALYHQSQKREKKKKRALYHQIELIDWLVTLFHFGLFSLCGDYGGLK